MATCEGLLNRLGFACRLAGEAGVDVSTPFTFTDGEPIGFYLHDLEDGVRLSDNANTLAHLATIGYDISDRKKWRGVKQTVETFGLELLDSGEIVGKEIKKLEHGLVTRYISAILAVVDWEREYLGIPDELDQFVKEAELYLRAWKPSSEISHYPNVQGHSGRMHTFHFELERQLIDAARPHGARTGSILRKAADVINIGDERKILVVMDDRKDVERAKIETDILSTMVSVMPFTRLISQVAGNINPS